MTIEKKTTFKRWVKGLGEAEGAGPTILYIRFCSLFNISKQQLGTRAQTWQRYFMQDRMADL